MMKTQVKYIKSFSKGQITIPKEFRAALGVEDEFWLKLYIQDEKIILEPMEKKEDREAYRNKLLKMKAHPEVSWDELERNRKQIDERIRKRNQ